MNTRILLRSLILFLALTALGLAAVSFLPPPALAWLVARWVTRPPDPTPLPPSIAASPGPMPAGVIAWQEWRHDQGGAALLVGSGFVLELAGGTRVGLTTAHSLPDLGQPGSPLEAVTFVDPAGAAPDLVFTTLRGPPGLPRTGHDLSVDYVLLRVDQAIAPGAALRPDPRGAPQPGERVSLFSGLGDGQGGQRELAGTVQSAGDQGVWVLMDETFDPGRMSGSPLVSQHTGQAVGMAVAASPRAGRILIGFHPIGRLAALAESASTFPPIAGFMP